MCVCECVLIDETNTLNGKALSLMYNEEIYAEEKIKRITFWEYRLTPFAITHKVRIIEELWFIHIRINTCLPYDSHNVM